MAIMQSENQILARVEQEMMSKVDAKMAQVVQRIVAAGMKVMFDSRTHELLVDAINKPGDLLENVGKGVADLMILLFQQSRGTMPQQAVGAASVILLCHALDYLGKTGKIQISNEIVAQATKAMMAYFLQRVGLTPQKMNALATGMNANSGKVA